MRFLIEREERAVLVSFSVGPYVAWAVWTRPGDQSGLLRGCGFLLGRVSWRIGERDAED